MTRVINRDTSSDADRSRYQLRQPMRTIKAWAVVALFAGLWAPAFLAAAEASKAEEVPVFSTTIHAVAIGLTPANGATGSKVPVTISIRDDATRIDFTGPRGDQVYVLAVAGGQQRWLVHRTTGMALPIPGTAGALRVDPAEPCAAMRIKCERSRGDVIAGTVVQGWRYRNAGGRGPDGTSSGMLWVDPLNGLVLGYRGELAGRPGIRELRAVSVSMATTDPQLFELPQAQDALSEKAKQPK